MDTRLADGLAARGFRAVDDAGLPGGWATDGRWTVCVQSWTGRAFDLVHEVVVYDHPPDEIGIDSEPVARVQDCQHARGIRRALETAGFEEGGTDA